jgi:hypothetical protein
VASRRPALARAAGGAVDDLALADEQVLGRVQVAVLEAMDLATGEVAGGRALDVGHGRTLVLLGLQLGSRESYESWRDFGRDLKGRGMRAPALVVADGAPGIWKAVGELWPAANWRPVTGAVGSMEPRTRRGSSDAVVLGFQLADVLRYPAEVGVPAFESGGEGLVWTCSRRPGRTGSGCQPRSHRPMTAPTTAPSTTGTVRYPRLP